MLMYSSVLSRVACRVALVGLNNCGASASTWQRGAVQRQARKTRGTVCGAGPEPGEAHGPYHPAPTQVSRGNWPITLTCSNLQQESAIR